MSRTVNFEFLGLEYTHPMTLEYLSTSSYTQTLSRSIVGVTFYGGAWRFRITLWPVGGGRQLDPLDGRLMSHRNYYKDRPFQIRCPQIHHAQANNVYPTGTRASGTLGQDTISLSGSAGANSVSSGTFVKIMGKVYQLSSSNLTTQLSAGAATFNVVPRLHATVSNATVEFHPMIDVRYNQEVQHNYETDRLGHFLPVLDVVTV